MVKRDSTVNNWLVVALIFLAVIAANVCAAAKSLWPFRKAFHEDDPWIG